MCIHSGLRTSTAAAGSFVDFLVKGHGRKMHAELTEKTRPASKDYLVKKNCVQTIFLQNSMEPLMSLR
jgi:hypothetical protein